MNAPTDPTLSFIRHHVEKLIRGGGGVLNSHLVAATEYGRRIGAGQSADEKQTCDYIQRCLREMPNVCRHFIGRGAASFTWRRNAPTTAKRNTPTGASGSGKSLPDVRAAITS